MSSIQSRWAPYFASDTWSLRSISFDDASGKPICRYACFYWLFVAGRSVDIGHKWITTESIRIQLRMRLFLIAWLGPWLWPALARLEYELATLSKEIVSSPVKSTVYCTTIHLVLTFLPGYRFSTYFNRIYLQSYACSLIDFEVTIDCLLFNLWFTIIFAFFLSSFDFSWPIFTFICLIQN